MNQRTLVVMRHAKSSWKTNDPDVRRPLSGRGTRDAVVAGQALARLTLDVVLCSRATRTQQTWQAMQLGGAQCSDVRVVDELYASWPDRVLSELRGFGDEVRTILVINHEPTVTGLTLALAQDGPLTAVVSDGFPTGAIAVLTHEQPWSELGPGEAALVAFEVPRG